MKYSPKHKIKSLKTDLFSKSDEILSLKEQIVHLTDQNHVLRRKLQLSQSNTSLLSEEFQLKSQLTNEEFSAVSQNVAVLQTTIRGLQEKLGFISHACYQEKTQKEAFGQELARLGAYAAGLEKEKGLIDGKLAKKTEKIKVVLREGEGLRQANEELYRECEELKKKNEGLMKENREYEDKLYRVQECKNKEETIREKDQKTVERNLMELQRKYEKLFEEFSGLDRLRDGFIKQRETDSNEINVLSNELKENTEFLKETKENLKLAQQELNTIKQDMRNLVMVLSSGNDKYPFLLDLKSESQELLLLKGLILDFLKDKGDSIKKEKKLMKHQSSLMDDYRSLQDKLTDLKQSMPVYQSPQHKPKEISVSSRFTREYKQEIKENTAENNRKVSISPYNRGSFLSDVRSNYVSSPNNIPLNNAFPNNIVYNNNNLDNNKSNIKYNDLVMVIGALLQIISLINVKFQWRSRLKSISRFSIDYFARIHESIHNASEDFSLNNMKTPRKGVKNQAFRRKIIKKLRKAIISVFFTEILLGFSRKKRFFQGDPGFFQAKFTHLPDDHVLNIAKNHFLLNNLFLNEIHGVFGQNYDNFNNLLNELILIDSPSSLLRTPVRHLDVDCSIIDIDYCNLNRIVREKAGGIKEKGKYSKDIENRIKSLNSEKKELKKKLEVRSKKLEDVERKCREKEKVCKEKERVVMEIRQENYKLKSDASYT